MPLHLIGECCKCKERVYKDLWAIKKNHGYRESTYVCSHFNVEIDHESSTGICGWGWRNKITVTAYYKPDGQRKDIIDRTFNRNDMEYQNYEVFSNKVVFHARISDSRGNAPTVGNNCQIDIEYNERREQQRLERERRERERREEKKRQLQRECDLKLKKLIEEEKKKEEERKNDLILLEEKCKRKTTSRRHQRIINLDIDGIFDLERRKLISKS